MEVQCPRCGTMCVVEEVKRGASYAWCEECQDYATEENHFVPSMLDAADALKAERKYVADTT